MYSNNIAHFLKEVAVVTPYFIYASIAEYLDLCSSLICIAVIANDFLLGIERKPPEKTLDVSGLTDHQIKALEQLVELMNTSPPDQ